MTYCLWCQEALDRHLNWEKLILPVKSELLCEACSQQLPYIQGETCHYCSRPSQTSACSDCQRWKQLYDGDDPLLRNTSIFSYNRFMKELITKWKYRGDYKLGELFTDVFRRVFKAEFASQMKDLIIMPIPLSTERQYERAFNQAEMLASFLNRHLDTSLTRIQSEKQSKKSRQERMNTINPFKLAVPIHKPVVLVDDIYTTGRTIRHAAEVLRENGCCQVYAYTLIRG